MNKLIFCIASLTLLQSMALAEKTALRGIFRVSSNISSGHESVAQIATNAELAGLDFIVMGDQLHARAEYGLPPFRNIFKISIARKDISSFGLEKYLDQLKSVQSQSKLAIICGADLAPAYFWNCSVRKMHLENRQFSQQMTVFGSEDPDFYRKLPVIHNDLSEEDWRKVARKCWPLLLSVLGVLTIVGAFVQFYSDGHCERPLGKRWHKILTGSALVLAGLLWTLDNRPLVIAPAINPYSRPDNAPYQKVIDYVHQYGGGRAGIIWSAPEAITVNRIFGITLRTEPYIGSVVKTYDHNGMAGIYGDTAKAHLPGREWDRMLNQHCRRERTMRPVIVGELDYHGKKDRPIALIQTTVFCERGGSRDDVKKAIVEAIICGNSYAMRKGSGGSMSLDKISLSCGTNSASLGEILELPPGKSSANLSLEIRGSLASEEQEELDFTVVVDGNQIISKKVAVAGGFCISDSILLKPDSQGRHYVRFELKGDKSGWILANPVFVVYSSAKI